MTIVNYFFVRWAEGYSHVSAAPTELVVALEQCATTITAAGDHATLAVRSLRVGDHTVSVALLRLDVRVSASPRRLQYAHAVVLPPEYRDLPIEHWRRVLVRRYGDDLEERIRELYERIAVTTKSDGRSLLQPLEVDAADLAAEATPQAPAPDGPPGRAPDDVLGGTAGDRPGAGAGAVRLDAPPPASPLARLVPALIAGAGVLLALLTYQCGRRAGADQAEAALRATRTRLDGASAELETARTELAAVKTKLSGVPADLGKCSTDLDTVRQQLGQKEQDLGAQKLANEKLADANRKLGDDKDALARDKASLTAAVAAERKRADDADTRAAAERQRLKDAYEDQLDAVRQLVAARQKTIDDHKRTIDQQRITIRAKDGELRAIALDITDVCNAFTRNRPDECDRWVNP